MHARLAVSRSIHSLRSSLRFLKRLRQRRILTTKTKARNKEAGCIILDIVRIFIYIVMHIKVRGADHEDLCISCVGSSPEAVCCDCAIDSSPKRIRRSPSGLHRTIAAIRSVETLRG